MSKMQKIVLFLVEGITDKVALEGVLSSIVEDREVSFQLTDGDVMTKKGLTTQNVVKYIGNYVKNYLENSRFEKSDILKIIHLVDTDGAFVDDDTIMYKDIEHIQYFPDKMETRDVDYIINRNKKKAGMLNKLISTHKISTIGYSIYFFSSNLEHVCYNKQEDLNRKEKMHLAEQFSDKYEDNPEEFLKFIRSKEIAVDGDYKISWEFIKQDCNSLNRFCNFHLFFDDKI